MRSVTYTLIDHIRAPADQLFATLTDPARIGRWLPGCGGAEAATPLRKGARLTVRFGERLAEFEIVDFTPPATFGWVERGQRRGTKMFFRLDTTSGVTAVTVREVWTPASFVAWLRGRLFPHRDSQRQLRRILDNLRALFTS